MRRLTSVAGHVAALVVLGCAPALRSTTPTGDATARTSAETLARQVEVIRTDYGVPHIYADNFEALGYALGYLQLEDYGERVPIGLLGARGELAKYFGAASLDSDFESRPYYLLARQLYFQLSQDTRDVYDGFATGVNRYIQQHPGGISLVDSACV